MLISNFNVSCSCRKSKMALKENRDGWNPTHPSREEKANLMAAAVDARLAKFCPNWQNKTLIIPPENLHELKLFSWGNIRGEESEEKALYTVKDFSQRKSLNMKIFHQVRITTPKMKALNEAFGVDLDLDGEFEIDIAALNERCTWLIEVKSNVCQVEKGFSQLNKAEQFFAKMTKSLACSGCGVPQKIFTAPAKDSWAKGASSKRISTAEECDLIYYLNLDAEDLDLRNLQSDYTCGKAVNFNRLIAAMAFLANPRLFGQDNSSEAGDFDTLDLRAKYITTSKPSPLDEYLTLSEPKVCLEGAKTPLVRICSPFGNETFFERKGFLIQVLNRNIPDLPPDIGCIHVEEVNEPKHIFKFIQQNSLYLRRKAILLAKREFVENGVNLASDPRITIKNWSCQFFVAGLSESGRQMSSKYPLPLWGLLCPELIEPVVASKIPHHLIRMEISLVPPHLRR